MHISRLMQSENGILVLFYIFLSHGNKKKWKKEGCKKGEAVSCSQARVKYIWIKIFLIQIFYHILKDLHFFNAIFLQCHAVVLGKNINKNNKLNNKITKKKLTDHTIIIFPIPWNLKI